MTSKYDALNDQYSQTQIQQFEVQKDRDICRFQLETIIDVLKKKKLYDEVVKEINGGVMPTQTGESTEASVFDTAFGNSGPTVLEEYQLKVEEQTRELNNLNLRVKSLQTDNQQMIEQATRDTRSLENKEMEIERMKRQNTKLQKELADLKIEQRRREQEGGKRSAPAPNVPSRMQKGVSVKASVAPPEQEDLPLPKFNSFEPPGRSRVG